MQHDYIIYSHILYYRRSNLPKMTKKDSRQPTRRIYIYIYRSIYSERDNQALARNERALYILYNATILLHASDRLSYMYIYRSRDDEESIENVRTKKISHCKIKKRGSILSFFFFFFNIATAPMRFLRPFAARGTPQDLECALFARSHIHTLSYILCVYFCIVSRRRDFRRF